MQFDSVQPGHSHGAGDGEGVGCGDMGTGTGTGLGDGNGAGVGAGAGLTTVQLSPAHPPVGSHPLFMKHVLPYDPPSTYTAAPHPAWFWQAVQQSASLYAGTSAISLARQSPPLDVHDPEGDGVGTGIGAGPGVGIGTSPQPTRSVATTTSLIEPRKEMPLYVRMPIRISRDEGSV